MENLSLGEMEEKFAELIWQNEPVPSGQLVKLCEEAFHWKKSTTYTMLKRLCQRKIFANNGGIVTALIKREDFHAMQGAEVIDRGFGGSLPQFLAAFTRRKKLGAEEVAELKKLIDEYKEG